MAKKKEPLSEDDLIQEKKHVIIRPRERSSWMNLMSQAAREHWRTLEVKIKTRDKLLAGKPAKLDMAKAMLDARGLSDTLEVVTDPEERVEEAALVAEKDSLCEFARRPGREGIWLPTNNIKAGIKENWSVLGYTVKRSGSKGAVAEGLFVYSKNEAVADKEDLDWVYLGDKPHGQVQAVVQAQTKQGPRSSLKRSEYVERIEITFYIAIAKAVHSKLGEKGYHIDEAIADMLVHFGEHGLGASRSQGFGKFDVLSVQDVENQIPKEAAAAA